MSAWNGFKLIKGAVTKTAADLNILQRDGQANPILPSTRDRTLEIPGRNGIFYFGADLAERRITIPCAFIYAANTAALETHAQELADFLLDDGKPAKLELIFEADKTKKWTVYYSGLAGLTRTVFDGEFDLPLVAADPLGVPRFTDNGDDTITDNASLLMWSKNAGASGTLTKANADAYVAALTLGTHEDWRTPTIAELLFLVDDNQSSPALPDGHPFTNVQYGPSSVDRYWSSTQQGDFWWVVYFLDGSTDTSEDFLEWWVWPVRTITA